MHARIRSFGPALLCLLTAACGGGGGGGNSPNPPVGNNAPPTANAGPDQAVAAGAQVTLNGGASTDSDGTVTTYTWTQTGGPGVTIPTGSHVQLVFTAPSPATASALTFSLVVRDDRGTNSSADSVTVNVGAVPGNVVGRVTYERIPTTAGNGLDYGAPVSEPARGVTVRVVAPGQPQNVLASTTTDSNGNYSASVADGTPVQIIVLAEMLRAAPEPFPRWNFRVSDLDGAGQVPFTPYSYTLATQGEAGSGTPLDVSIPSGFNASGAVTGTRASAPFAILDTVYQAAQLVAVAEPQAEFPALVLDWAPNNPGGETFFTTFHEGLGQNLQHIVLSAEVTEDTDEFDPHVVAHEFGHYVEYNFSRADNIGGAHGLGDRLDIRTAFGEGFGYAFGAIVLDESDSRDTFVSGGNQVTSRFDVEDNPPAPSDPTGCWCSESSVWSILWDVYDDAADAGDSVNLGFAPLWQVLTGAQRTTPAFTSIFSFATALKSENPASASGINALLNAQNIDGGNIDAFGSSETHVPIGVPSVAALPLYTTVSIGGSVTVRNVNDAGTDNTVGNHRFIRFEVPSARSITVTVSTSNPDVANRDPDFLVYRSGDLVALGFDGPDEFPETETFNAPAGTYLIDAYDCANGCNPPEGNSGDYDLTVTVASP